MLSIAELFAALKKEPALYERFQKEPAAVIGELISETLEAEQLQKLEDGVNKLIMKEKAEAMILGSGLFPRA